MSEPLLDRLARTILPQRLFHQAKGILLAREARRFSNRCAAHRNIARVVGEGLTSPYFPLEQKRAEIVALLDIVGRIKPVRLCEIGGRMGGSLAAFVHVAAPGARLLSIDIGYSPHRQIALPALARPGQTIVCRAADSHAVETVEFVSNWLGGQLFDFLFIDGDHSFEGVKADFQRFAGFVRAGGIIAFHDIVPDSWIRHGVRTTSDVGGVPHFWQELKAGPFRVEEHVENWDQDGFGIGVLYWDGANRPTQPAPGPRLEPTT